MITHITRQLHIALRNAPLDHRPLLLAVSGGGDSMALLRAAIALQQDTSNQFSVAHFDHSWRADSHEDARFVQRVCAEAGIDAQVGHAEQGLDQMTEEAARTARYRFLLDTAEQQGCGAILTGHTADDQAETVLHHLLRGTGVAGLTGIPSQRPLTDRILLIRPLLGLTRADLRVALAEWGQEFREDPTNESNTFTRNRLRREVFPLVSSIGYRDAIGKLSQLAEQAREVHAAISWMGNELLSKFLLEETPDRCRLTVAELSAVPRHLLREMFVELWKRRDWPRKKMGYADWDRLAELILRAGSISLPGKVTASRGGAVLLIERS